MGIELPQAAPIRFDKISAVAAGTCHKRFKGTIPSFFFRNAVDRTQPLVDDDHSQHRILKYVQDGHRKLPRVCFNRADRFQL